MKKVKKVKKIKKVRKINKVKSKKINWKLITRIELLILAVFFVIGIYQIYEYVPGVKEAVALATTVKPETFTELYFENHRSLPSKITYNEDNKFKFTIHNLENKDMNYPYEVYINLNGEKQIIEKSSVFIKSGKYKTIDEDFTISLPTARVEVIANLINKNQQIDFWIEGAQ
jgi:hypothetical protein